MLASPRPATAAFLSSGQNAFTFPDGRIHRATTFSTAHLNNTANGPARRGEDFSSMAFSDINRFKNPLTYNPAAYGRRGDKMALLLHQSRLWLSADRTELVLPVACRFTSRDNWWGNCGRSCRGEGANSRTVRHTIDDRSNLRRVDEDVALAAQNGYQPSGGIRALPAFLINGLRLPYMSTAHRN